MNKVMTLCIVELNGNVLLGLKKKGFGEGRWNGFGGKVLSGESIEQAALRELKEEAGILAKTLEKRGVLRFEILDMPELLEVHVFGASDFDGEPAETEEMKPQWFAKSDIPFGIMWPDDQYWLPLFLEGKTFQGRFYFKDLNTLLHYALEVDCMLE